MSDTEPTRETVPTTTYLPDHLLAGDRAGIPTVRSIEDEGTDGSGEVDGSGDASGDDAADGERDPAAEFCRSWRRHRSGSRSFPF